MLLGITVVAAAGCDTGNDAPAFDVDLDLRVTEVVARDSTGHASCSWVANARAIGDPGVESDIRGGAIDFGGALMQMTPEEAAGFWGSSTLATGQTLTFSGQSTFQSGPWEMTLEFWWVPRGSTETVVAQDSLVCDPPS